MTMIVFNICCGNSRFPITRPPDFIRHGLWGLTGARCQQGGGADLQGPRLSALWQTGMQHSTTVSMSWLQDDRRSPARWRFPSMGVPKIDGLVHEKSHEIGWLGVPLWPLKPPYIDINLKSPTLATDDLTPWEVAAMGSPCDVSLSLSPSMCLANIQKAIEAMAIEIVVSWL